MKISTCQFKQIVKEELEAAQAESSPFGPRPADAPANLTTADLDGDQFITLIKAWGKEVPEKLALLHDIIASGKLKENYELLRQKMAKEGAGKLPRKFMPVIKKGFIEDLLVRLKDGKLDLTDPWAPTSGKMKKKQGKRVKKGTMSPEDAAMATQTATPPPTNESLSTDSLHNLIIEVLSEVSQERYEKYKSLRAQGYSPGQQQHLPDEKFPSGDDFNAMPNSKKAKSYWLNKGHMDGNETDDVVKVEFQKLSVADLHPSQDRVYADKIAWKLLEYGLNTLAPTKDFKMEDPTTGATGNAPDWRYRSIVIEGGLLLDGHHKWALACLSGPTAQVPVLFIPQLSLSATIKLLRSYGAAHGFAGQA